MGTNAIRWIAAMVFGWTVITSGSDAMGQSSEGISVACQGASGKVAGLDDLCDLFAERVSAALAAPVAKAPSSDDADLVLVVLSSGSASFSARIDRAGSPGEPRATARRGAPLDDAARAALLDDLISLSGLR